MFKIIKNMPFKKKVEYIWDYYRFHILALLVAIFVGVLIIHGQMTAYKNIFNLTLIGNGVSYENQQNLENGLTKILGDEKKREKAFVDLMPVEIGEDGLKHLKYQYKEKFFAEIASKDVDIVILEKVDFDAFAKEGDFYKLTDINGLNLKGINTLSVSGDKLKSGPYGIKIDDNRKLKEIGFDTENKVLCILINSKNINKCAKVIEWLGEDAGI